MTVAPTAIDALVAIELPDPLAVAQLEPPDAAHDQFTPVNAAGTASVTALLSAKDGPELVTRTVYVTTVPGTASVMPSSFVTERSARGVTLSVSVALLFVAFVSVKPAGAPTPAVLTSVLVPAGVVAARVPTTVYVAVAAAGTVADVAIVLPEPETVPHSAPPVVAQVHVTPVIAAGTVSVIGADEAVDGPAFATTMV